MVEQRADDAKLALDLIAQLQDPKWALEQARIEDEANCDISAGGSTSEGSGRHPHRFAKLLAEVTVTVESALQSNIDDG